MLRLMIVGRTFERFRLNRLVADAKDGQSRTLLLRGEAGIGKTALLDYAADTADGMRVLRVSGIESEAEIPFAAVQLMLAAYADRIDALPQPQARALRSAVGMSSDPGDRLLVGAATMTLLSDLAGHQPLLCLLDDVQWFDQSSIDSLLFALRRLHTDPIATILAVRDGDRPFTASGIESLPLTRLESGDAANLVTAVRTLPRDVTDRIVAESGGNPLAIVELASTGSEAGHLPAAVAPLPATGRLEGHYRQQIRGLPERTRRALLLAAADSGLELQSFVVATSRFDVQAADLEPAEAARLVQVTPEAVQFRHPLIRAAAYQEAPFAERLDAHRALAEVLSDPREADRRAWHLAAAAAGIDENTAMELEHAAERATARGAPASAARALYRAAQLSNGQAAQARRLIAAARAAYDAGQLDRAAELSAAGAALTVDAGEVADAAWIRAQVAYERSSPAEASALALQAAAPVLVADPNRAASVLIEASWCARDAADEELLRQCGDQARAVRGGRAVVTDAVAAFADYLRSGDQASVSPMQKLLSAAHDDVLDGTLECLAAGFMGLLIGEDETARSVLEDIVAGLRTQGALGWLPYAQEPLALAQLVTGRFRDAETNVAEAVSTGAELGLDLQVVVLTAISAWLAAVRGDVATSAEQAHLVLGDTRRHAMAARHATWALALIDLMAGHADSALDRLDDVCAGPVGWDVTIRAIPDHVEAAVRAGRLDRARRHLPRLAAWAGHVESAASTALLLRCEALLADGEMAEQGFQASLRIEGCGPYDRARTQVAYGEWLRRHRRRTEARAVLVEALFTFERIAAGGWRHRVHTELGALGGPIPDLPADDDGGRILTPQELQVVRRAALGLSNREIAAQLFISPRTVGYHLYKAYPKLGVSRRTELAHLDV